MTAALITAILLGIGGLAYSTVLGFVAETSDDVVHHVSIAIFSTLITLLAHSMTMFYLIGKGKAIRETVAESGLSSDLYARVARARRPVFSMGSLAMGFTIIAAALGGGVDAGTVASGFHAVLAILGLVTNFMTLRLELLALVVAADVVVTVDQSVT